MNKIKKIKNPDYELTLVLLLKWNKWNGVFLNGRISVFGGAGLNP